MKDPRPLVQHVYEMLIEDYVNKMRTGGYLSVDEDLFKSLYNETTVPLPGLPLHNKYINYYNHKEDDKKKRPRDTTSVYVPSRLFVFHGMLEDVTTSRQYYEEMEIPECAMSIQNPGTVVSKSLLTTCFSICDHQPVTDLRSCSIPPDVCAELLRSLSSCHQLTHLDLSGNSLLGGLFNFLPDPDHTLPSLAKLELNNTSLNNEDIHHLKNLIRMRKVPELRSLGLVGNRLHEMEEEVEGLIHSCLDYHTKNINLKINDKGQPEEFEAKWMRILEGKHVSINALDDDVSSFSWVL